MLFDKENSLPNNSFKNISPSESSNASNYDLCLEYASHLKMTAPESFEVLEFRSKWSEKFRSICFMQLSFLIDVPLDLFHESNDQANTYLRQSTLKNLLTRRGFCPEVSTTSSVLTPEICFRIKQLMHQIKRTGADKTEGLFRKTGNLKRQREIILAVMQENSSLNEFKWREFSPHELAGALKACISHLTSPLLTDNLLPLFIQASKLHDRCPTWSGASIECSSSQRRKYCYTDNSQQILSSAKQLKSFRLLMQLLPPENREVLRTLLSLLHQVVRKNETTRMTAKTLGTVFGPVFSPFIIECNELHNKEIECRKQCQEAIDLATQLIELNGTLFNIPNSLVQDIHKNITSSYQNESITTSTETTPPGLYQSDPKSCASSTPIRSWSPCPSSIFFGSHGKKLNKEKKTSPLHTTIRFATSNRFEAICGAGSPLQYTNSISTDLECIHRRVTHKNQVADSNGVIKGCFEISKDQSDSSEQKLILRT